MVAGLSGIALSLFMEPGTLFKLMITASSTFCLVGLFYATFCITGNSYDLSGGTSNFMAKLRVLSTILVTVLSLAVFAMCIASYIVDKQQIFIP